MLLVVRGNYVHTWIYFGDLEPGQRPTYVQCQGKTLSRMGCDYRLAKGRYHISKVWMPKNKCHWFVLDGFPVGASCGSVLQWAGEAWENHDLGVYENGVRLLNPTREPGEAGDINGEYTIEAQEERIRRGIITDRHCIYKHARLKKKYDDMAILRGIRQMVKSHEVGCFLKSYVRWAGWKIDTGRSVPEDDGCYRLDLRHRLPDGNTGQMFAGVRVDGGELVVDHCRDRSGNVDYKLLDSTWPTFELADPNCFEHLLSYLLECRLAGSDQKLQRYARRRSQLVGVK